MKFRDKLLNRFRIGDISAALIDDDVRWTAEPEPLDNSRLLIREDRVSDFMLLADRANFLERIRDALLKGERDYLDVMGLELLPDLFL